MAPTSFKELKQKRFFWKLEPDFTEEEVEPKVRPLVRAINQFPHTATYSSCEGHKFPPIYPYVSIYLTKEGQDFLKCVEQLPNVEVETFEPESQVSKASLEPLIGVEIRFKQYRSLSEKDYREVIRCLRAKVNV